MAELARRRATVLVPLLLAAAVGLMGLLAYNLRNVDPGAEELPPIPTIEPPPEVEVQQGSGNALRALFLAVMLTIAVLAVAGSIYLYVKGVKVWKLVSVWELLGFALALTLLVVVFLWWDQVYAGLNNFIRWVTGPRESEPGEGGSPGPLPPTATSPSMILLIVAIGIVGAYAVAFAFLFLPRMYGIVAEAPPDIAKPKRELARTVRRAIADLAAGGDFREAVLRCYHSMLLLFAQHGLRPDPSQTAREFESAALNAYGVTRETIDDLTSLFEEARYSTHPIGETQRDAAIECLNGIRRQLEAPT